MNQINKIFILIFANLFRNLKCLLGKRRTCLPSSTPLYYTLIGPIAILAWYCTLYLYLCFSQKTVSYQMPPSFYEWKGVATKLNVKPRIYEFRNFGSMDTNGRVLVITEYKKALDKGSTWYSGLGLKVLPNMLISSRAHIFSLLQGNRIPYDIEYNLTNIIDNLPIYNSSKSSIVYDVIIFDNAHLYQKAMNGLSHTDRLRFVAYVNQHGTALVVIPTFSQDYHSSVKDVSGTQFYPFRGLGSQYLVGMQAHQHKVYGQNVLKLTRPTNMIDGDIERGLPVMGLLPLTTTPKGDRDPDETLKISKILASSTLNPMACGNSTHNLTYYDYGCTDLQDDNTTLPTESQHDTNSGGTTLRRSVSLVIWHPINLVEGKSPLDVVFFGGLPSVWPFRLLLLDTLLYFMFRANDRRKSKPSEATPPPNPMLDGLREKLLDRWIGVDIDDGFVGEIDPSLSDIKALIKFQEEMKSKIADFTFNIGYSGLFYPSQRIDGQSYRYLIENQDKFWWFPHSWDHRPSYEHYNITTFNQEINLNTGFGQEWGLDRASNQYSVSPKHSGTFPCHGELFKSWNSHNISISSTYLYPRNQPASGRRAFIFNNIMVLPRQTCGLFTHSVKMDLYPGGGKEALDREIEGGPLFDTFINNMVNIYMTHIPNYMEDRLAFYVIRKAVSFLTKYTNIRLRAAKPMDLAKIYFQHYPQDKTVLWQNPCLDNHQFELWHRKGECYRIPKILIVGPQKTGTTALLSFLMKNPLMRTNVPTKNHEEVQFFNDDNVYELGLDWYMDLFKLEPKFPFTRYNLSWVAFVEKSANYFDNPKVPMRSCALIPYAKIITILIDPIDRAYSWYQHVKSHGDRIARKYTFYQALTTDVTKIRSEDDRSGILKLRYRMLVPGHYITHLERWAQYYSIKQIYVIDGNEFKKDPRPIMGHLQKFLELQKYVNYDQVLRYDSTKSFYCLINHKNRTKCLGSGKGRSYKAMDEQSMAYLLNYYRPYNNLLYDWLEKYNKTIPTWLKSPSSHTI